MFPRVGVEPMTREDHGRQQGRTRDVPLLWMIPEKKVLCVAGCSSTFKIKSVVFQDQLSSSRVKINSSFERVFHPSVLFDFIDVNMFWVIRSNIVEFKNFKPFG
jgi:hypothetical protein